MRTNIRLAWLFIIAAGLILPAAFSQEGSSPFDPAPAGTRLSGIIECGRGYTSHELYNMKITLLEILRGEDAWERLQTAGGDNKPADSGFEYLLTRVKFEYSARGTPGLCVHKLLPEQFTACSKEAVDYPAAGVTVPQPEMRGEVHSGESLEGWIAFVVPKTDKTPLLNYSADAGGAVLHGSSAWFKLY